MGARVFFWHSLEVRYPDQRVGAVTFSASGIVQARRWLDDRHLVPVDLYWESRAVVTEHERPNLFTAGHGLTLRGM